MPAYRSKFEGRVIAALKKRGVQFEYEPIRLPYNRPQNYIPDIVLANGIIVEIKGRFTSSDRTKMILVQEAHPDKDIRLVFQRGMNKLYKGSITTYAQWAKQHGFQWAEGFIPLSWINEDGSQNS